MPKLKYYVACTVDGFIAAEDGSFDAFLTEGEHFADLLESFPETVPSHLRDALGIRADNKQFDVVLMGRNTYEVGLKVGVTDPYPTMKQYLFSRTLKESPDENVELVSGDALAVVRDLKQGTGKDIWLCGGGDLAAALFPEIDEIILKSNPVLLGSGIPIISGGVEQIDLELTHSKVYGNGFMLLHYRTKR